jgi:hypothetical protein
LCLIISRETDFIVLIEKKVIRFVPDHFFLHIWEYNLCNEAIRKKAIDCNKKRGIKRSDAIIQKSKVNLTVGYYCLLTALFFMKINVISAPKIPSAADIRIMFE